jgi:hypothetical protein
MQLTTLIIALLAGISEARRGHHYRLIAADPPSDDICYRGSQKKYPVTGKDTPPCWYKESDGSNSCYEYEPTTGKCPNFPNPISKPSYHLRASSHRKNISNKSHLRASGHRKYGGKRNNHYSLKASNPPSGAICFRGNQKKFPVSGKEAPPCWFAESDSSFSCYEYEPTTGKCPNFPNPVSKPSYRLRAQQAGDRDTCYAGNMRDKPIQDPKRELCWYKQSDGVNACFAKLNGRCPF